MKGRIGIAALWLALLGSGVGLAGSQARLMPAAERQRGDIMLDAFGEFRTVMARYLWFKMDLFHEVLDDEGVTDTRQAELLPLLRMISLLDPSMTDAYDNIAWDLYKGHHQPDQAISILDEGLERNPASYQLYFRRSLICFQSKMFAESQASAERAVSLAQGEVEKLNANRMLYWSAKELKDKVAMERALDVLISLRPEDQVWRQERAHLSKGL